MPTHRQLIVEVPVSERGPGSSDSASLSSAFGSSPIHGNEVNDEYMKSIAQSLLLDGVVNDGGHTFGQFNRDYTDSPNMEEVDVEGNNLASPFVPNPSSPGPGSVNSSDIPRAPEGFGQEPNDQWGSGVGSQLSPNQSSQAQSTSEINNQQFGQGPSSS